MYNDGDNEPLLHHGIKSTDRPLSAKDHALLATPKARELARRYPGWGPERIKCELKRTSGK